MLTWISLAMTESKRDGQTDRAYKNSGALTEHGRYGRTMAGSEYGTSCTHNKITMLILTNYLALGLECIAIC